MIKIVDEISIDEFEPWGGAMETLEKIKRAGACDMLEFFINDCYPDGLSSTELNDMLWFKSDNVLEACGIVEEEEEEEED